LLLSSVAGPIVYLVKLDVYRSCTRQEKREVLEAFWRRSGHPTARVHEAALQYGPFAVISLVTVVLELALVIFVSLHRAPVVGWLAVAFEAIVVLSLWWSLVRFRAISAHASELT
jgi:hypothetical protein